MSLSIAALQAQATQAVAQLFDSPRDALVRGFEVFIPGEPKPQPRVRARVRNGKVEMFTPGTIKGFKTALSTRVAALWGFHGEVFLGPVVMELILLHQRPPSHYRKPYAKLKRGTPLYPMGPRYDVDNTCKAVMDALEGSLYRNDGQVCSVDVQKFYAEVNETPGVCLAAASMTPDGQWAFDEGGIGPVPDSRELPILRE